MPTPEILPAGSLALAIVIPVYNEAACIEEVIRSWGDFMLSYLEGRQFKIIVINDGSKDLTPQILDGLARELPYLDVIHQPNGGHGNAVLHGYRRAVDKHPEWVFQVDSDNQFISQDFPALWERRNQSCFILGHRQKRYDDANRLVITRIMRLLNRTLFGVYIADSNIPYRLIKGNYLPGLLQVLPAEPFAPNIFLAVLARKDGNDVLSIPVTHKERETGQVSIIKWNLLKVCIRTARELAAFSLSLNKRLKKLKVLNS
jgi:dolichol-phosphate mannosyltransferase